MSGAGHAPDKTNGHNVGKENIGDQFIRSHSRLQIAQPRKYHILAVHAMKTAFDLAAKQLGMNEVAQKGALQDYLSTGGVNLDPAVTAWCAAYVNATLAQTGQKGTGSNMARDFLKWGRGVDKPQKGDLAVFSRGDPNGPYGHVGFFNGYGQDGSIQVLGGNQSDGVSIQGYGADRLLGYRRAGDAAMTPTYTGGGPEALAAQGKAAPDTGWRDKVRAIFAGGAASPASGAVGMMAQASPEASQEPPQPYQARPGYKAPEDSIARAYRLLQRTRGGQA